MVYSLANSGASGRAQTRRVPPVPAPSAAEPQALLPFEQSVAPGRPAPLTLPGGKWVAQGPGPILGGQVENLQPAGSGDPVTGAVQAVAPHPTDPDILYIGSVNGGVWRTTNARAAAPDWTPLTDQFPSLSIAELAFDPTDPTNMTLVASIGSTSSFAVAGPRAGLLRTRDGGASWEPLGQTVFGGASIAAVVPRGEIILVALHFGTEPGVYRSMDDGKSFQIISGKHGLPKGLAYTLSGDPGEPMRIYAGIGPHIGESNLGRSTASMGNNGGLFRSDNAGASWSAINGPTLGAALKSATDLPGIRIAVSAAPGHPVYAGIVNHGVLAWLFRSADRGSTWTAMDLPRTLERPVPVTDASDTKPIIVTSANHGLLEGNQVRIEDVKGNTAANGDFTITVISNDQFALHDSWGNGAYAGGGTWSAIQGIHNVRGAGRFLFSLAADPTNPNLVYVGGDAQYFIPNSVGADDYEGRLFRGDAGIAPGGAGVLPSPQWTPLTHIGTLSNSAPHADSRNIAFDVDGNLLLGDDGGVYRRTSPASSAGDWFSVIGTLQVTEMHDVAYDRNSDIIIGGSQDTGTPEQISPGSTTWRTVSTADGGDVAVDTTSVPGQSIRYSSEQFLGEFVRRTCDVNNLCEAPVPIGLQVVSGAKLSPRFVTPIALNRRTPTRLLVGGANGVFESADQGDHITQLTGTSGNILSLVYGHQNNADLIVASSRSGLFIRTTAGSTLSPTPTQYPGIQATDIVVDPVDETSLFVAGLTQVFSTLDAGATWIDITGNLGAAGAGRFQTIEYVKSASDDRVLVGTSAGVFASMTSDAGCWFELGEGLPNAPVFDLDYDATADMLVAATVGRGAWTLKGISQFGVPALSAPESVTFDNTCVGATSLEPIEICNSGTEILDVTSITSSDPQFSIAPPSSGFPLHLDPDSCRQLEISFAPVSGSEISAVVSVQSNDPCRLNFGVKAGGLGQDGPSCRR